MAANTTRRRQKGAPPGVTGHEALYLRFLSDKQVPVNVKLHDGEVVFGWIEYFDDTMIRLTREGKPNLFIYKQQIRTISELVRKSESKRRTATRKADAAVSLVDGVGAVPAASVADHDGQSEEPLSGEPSISEALENDLEIR